MPPLDEIPFRRTLAGRTCSKNIIAPHFFAALRLGFHRGTLLKKGESCLVILSSSIDKTSADFSANAEKMRSLV
jgi:hypothetical protein